jgi:transcriptional regulator with XRE-family HTH domain
MLSGMKLAAYLDARGSTAAAFAVLVGTNATTIMRAASGAQIPRRNLMARIHAATGGAVTANDFYNLGDHGSSSEVKEPRAEHAAPLSEAGHEKLTSTPPTLKASVARTGAEFVSREVA